jgi:hypothetical protein
MTTRPFDQKHEKNTSSLFFHCHLKPKRLALGVDAICRFVQSSNLNFARRQYLKGLPQ